MDGKEWAYRQFAFGQCPWDKNCVQRLPKNPGQSKVNGGCESLFGGRCCGFLANCCCRGFGGSGISGCCGLLANFVWNGLDGGRSGCALLANCCWHGLDGNGRRGLLADCGWHGFDGGRSGCGLLANCCWHGFGEKLFVFEYFAFWIDSDDVMRILLFVSTASCDWHLFGILNDFASLSGTADGLGHEALLTGDDDDDVLLLKKNVFIY